LYEYAQYRTVDAKNTTFFPSFWRYLAAKFPKSGNKDLEIFLCNKFNVQERYQKGQNFMLILKSVVELLKVTHINDYRKVKAYAFFPCLLLFIKVFGFNFIFQPSVIAVRSANLSREMHQHESATAFPAQGWLDPEQPLVSPSPPMR
jgi:hypothetical protein